MSRGPLQLLGLQYDGESLLPAQNSLSILLLPAAISHRLYASSAFAFCTLSFCSYICNLIQLRPSNNTFTVFLYTSRANSNYVHHNSYAHCLELTFWRASRSLFSFSSFFCLSLINCHSLKLELAFELRCSSFCINNNNCYYWKKINIIVLHSFDATDINIGNNP